MSWPTSWTRAQRLVITVPAGTVAPLAYFPVVLTAASLPTELTDNTYGRSDGGDLAFAADLGTGNTQASIGAQIPCEVVSAAFGGSPSAEIHVQVPAIAATGTLTYIWVLYGNSGQTAQPAAGTTYGSQAVWNENGTQNFAAVWHFGTAATLSLVDSTANGNTLTNSGTATNGTGAYGGAVSLNGSSQLLYNSTLSISNPVTSSVHLKKTVSNVGAFIYDAYSATGRQALGLDLSGSDTAIGMYAGNAVVGHSGFTGGWEQVGGVFNGASSYLYRSGAADLSLVDSGANVFNDGITIAKRYYTGTNIGATYFGGLIEEFRLSAAARSASWFAAEWASWNAPGTFIQPPGGQGPISISGVTFTPWIFNNDDC